MLFKKSLVIVLFLPATSQVAACGGNFGSLLVIYVEKHQKVSVFAEENLKFIKVAMKKLKEWRVKVKRCNYDVVMIQF